jgi:methylglyoxal reductase
MEHRQLENTDLNLPVVTFGAWAIGGLFWGGSDDSEAIVAIHACLDNGMDAIDTAPIYGTGHSERLIGRALAGRRNRTLILTKCGLRWDDTNGEFFMKLEATPDGRPVIVYKNVRAGSIVHECEQSLKRLATDVIDLYQVHWPSSSAGAEETVGALIRLKEQGKIRHFGVSNYDAGQMRAALEFGPIVSNQVRYNLLDRRIETEIVPFCLQNHLGLICYSPMALGLLSGKVSPEREFPPSDIRSTHPQYSRANRLEVLRLLEAMRPIADRHGATLGQTVIAWVIHQPGVTTALVGARNRAQVEENAAAARVKLSEAELAKISEIFSVRLT